MTTEVGMEHHRSHRMGWLRAAVLGANDGIVSVASLVIGVAAASNDHTAIATAGVAGLVAGAMSMATGEFVSVSSQRDVEEADLKLERDALETHPDVEMRELATIYERRGLTPELAMQVAEQLHERDAFGAHIRDELGITEIVAARPLQAAWVSTVSFTIGALFPLLAVLLAPAAARIVTTAVVALVALVALGALGARAGGAPWLRGAVRVLVWSSLAMALTYGIGRVVGANIG